MKTIIGLYLVITFIATRCAYTIAGKLIKAGAAIGGLLLIEPFRAEISAVLIIAALLFIMKKLVNVYSIIMS